MATFVFEPERQLLRHQRVDDGEDDEALSGDAKADSYQVPRMQTWKCSKTQRNANWRNCQEVTEERHAPGKFGQLSEDGLHVKDLASDEEANTDGGKVDNPRGHLGRDYLHFENEP